MAIDGHAGGVAIEHLQALRDICHTDTHPCPRAAFFDLSSAHTDTVVLNFDDQARVCKAAAKINAAPLHLGGKTMLDGIFNQRLQQHAGNDHIERSRIDILDHAQLVGAKADHFDVEIIVDELEFVPVRCKGLAAVKEAAENGGQFENHLAGRVGIEPHQRRNRIQCVEQEMRIDLVLQRLHAGVQQKPFLLFELDLNADAVKNL